MAPFLPVQWTSKKKCNFLTGFPIQAEQVYLEHCLNFNYNRLYCNNNCNTNNKDSCPKKVGVGSIFINRLNSKVNSSEQIKVKI